MPPQTMLGRVVAHHSPATLSSVMPRQSAFASMPSAQMPSRQIGRGPSAKSTAQAGRGIGAAVGFYLREPTSEGMATQSAGYQAYRAGERESY